MTSDMHGHALTGATTEAAAHYERAHSAFNLYRGDPIALLGDAIAAAPGFAMAHILKGYLFALATEPEATRQAASCLDEIKGIRLSEREAGLAAAMERMIAGEWTSAAVALDRHSMRFPRDLVALQVGHLTDFYRANARDLRDRIARALGQWSPDMSGYSIVLGMHAFGLEETGDYARAEDRGREAVALQPLDGWAHHAVAHVMEMQGRASDGVTWMGAREADWSDDANFFKGHNWWHKALFHLDLGQGAEALALYDDRIRRGRSMVVLDMIDASALLWRLHMSGVDVGARWSELAEAWKVHADGHTYPFNDWHAAMAYLGAGRSGDLERLVAQLGATCTQEREASRWAGTACSLIEGFSAFWRGDNAAAVETLHGARFIANSFGGSHAQRDIIDWTLTEAALRGGMRDVAVALASERAALKPHSGIAKGFLHRSVCAGAGILSAA